MSNSLTASNWFYSHFILHRKCILKETERFRCMSDSLTASTT